MPIVPVTLPNRVRTREKGGRKEGERKEKGRRKKAESAAMYKIFVSGGSGSGVRGSGVIIIVESRCVCV